MSAADDEFGVAEDLEDLLAAPSKPAKKTGAKPEPPAGSVTLTTEQLAELKASLRSEIEADLAARPPVINVTVPPQGRQGPQSNDDLTTLSVSPPPEEKDTGILVHFIEDGFTVGGRVFYRGEEYWAPRNTEWAKLSMADQILRWKKQFFRPGPWPGGGFDLTDPNLTEDDRAKLLEVMRKRETVG